MLVSFLASYPLVTFIYFLHGFQKCKHFCLSCFKDFFPFIIYNICFPCFYNIHNFIILTSELKHEYIWFYIFSKNVFQMIRMEVLNWRFSLRYISQSLRETFFWDTHFYNLEIIYILSNMKTLEKTPAQEAAGSESCKNVQTERAILKFTNGLKLKKSWG